MTLLAVSLLLLGWLALILSLGPWSAYGASPTVELNGTKVIGTSQRFTDNVTIESFGGKYPDNVLVAETGSFMGFMVMSS